jgi:hypothetical protein
VGAITKARLVRRQAARRGSRALWGRLALVLLLAFAPALNLAAPMAPRDSHSAADAMPDMARADSAPASSEPCTHANVVADTDAAGCDAGDHGNGAHHADPLCLQCIAFGTPGLAGAPDIGTVLALPAVAASYTGNPNSLPTSRIDAAYFSRGPPRAV